jgi:hypothetical protein
MQLRFADLKQQLPIETGWWQNISRENRKCTLWNRSQIGDEYHYIFECNYYTPKRKQSLSTLIGIRRNKNVDITFSAHE